MPDTPASRSRLTLARRLCLQYNTGWWLDRLNPLLVALAIPLRDGHCPPADLCHAPGPRSGFWSRWAC
ncbi:MAG: hypothetical protein R3F31_18255 [Verrucomicrobiales bacterium]